MKRLIYMSVLIILAISCAKDIEINDSISEEVTLTASYADCQTKTILPDSETSVYWEPGDEIMVYSGTEGSKFSSTLSEPATVSDFTGILSNRDEGQKLLAVYPYDNTLSYDGNSITTTLPNEQEARPGSFAKNLNLSMAESDSFSMKFYNVCGGLCFKLSTEGIREITLMSNNKESIAGKVKIAFDKGVPIVKTIKDGEGSIILRAPDNGTFTTDKWLYIVSLPVTLSGGFKMTFKTDTKYATLTSLNSATINRGVFARISNIDKDLNWRPLGNIDFKDSTVKSLLVRDYDTNKDGELSYEEASAVTYINFRQRGITSFEEFKYFDNVTELSDHAFGGCTSLTAVSIPSSVKKIGNSCFGDCSSLSSIEIPSSVTEIGSWCFNDCKSLSNIEIPSSVTKIGDHCFSYCESLSTIKIPSSVTEIESNCFLWCTHLSNIEIPSSVTALGEFCFSGCKSLSSIEIPSSVTTLGKYCFNGCKSLSSIEIPSSVTELSYGCFSRCSALSYIKIPSSVTKLGDSCFYQCIALSHIEIPTSVTEICATCFSECKSLSSIDIPSSVTELGWDCFNDCSSLCSVNLSSSIKKLNGECFRDCVSLSSIEIPSSVTEIGYKCFSGCTHLPHIDIPSSVTTLGESCFNYCHALRSIKIPESVTQLPRYCFRRCTSLTSVELPSTVTEIGEECFVDCFNLTEMRCHAISVPSLGNDVFYGTKVSLKGYLYVPEESIQRYKHDGWGEWLYILKLE